MSFPDRQSVDNIAALGNEGWTFDEMLPYYRKFHTFHEPDAELIAHLGLDYSDTSAHGTSGPVQVSFGKHQTDLDAAWGRTFANLGCKATKDPQSGSVIGGVNLPACLDPKGFTRSHSAAAYLTDKVKTRPNLKIVTEALVEKVILNGTTASGVQYVVSEGIPQIAHGKEIIICGGAFNSPQILELSGIGSKRILEGLGIESKVDLPGVGANLQDHTLTGGSWETVGPTLDSFRDPAIAGAAFQEYQASQSGPMSNGTWNLAFLPTGFTDAEKREFSTLLEGFTSDGDKSCGLLKQHQVIRKTIEDPQGVSSSYILVPVSPSPDQSPVEIPPDAANSNFLSIWASVAHPFSRGTVHIRSSDIHDHPTIDPRYFSHPADVEIAVKHLQNLKIVTSTAPLVDQIKPQGMRLPANLDQITSNVDAAREHVKTGTTCYHPCGTCSMMPREDDGVVDNRLRVYGVKGLRVVDASVLPLIPQGNIQTSVYAFAEQAADFIKQDLGKA